MRLGLIPAHAGKTPDRVGGHQDGRAHPRSRGENMGVETAHSSVSGSSPLTRGKPFSFLFTIATRGLIPAHAGKTHLIASTSASSAAHPRSRGENGDRVCISG